MAWIAALVAGCGGEAAPPAGPPSAEVASAPGADASPSGQPAPAASAPFEGTVGKVESPRPDAPPALLTGVRIAAHDSFDRIVFEFAGPNVPGYRIEYIDKPVRQCGSGDPTPIAGDAWLEIALTPANAHDENGVATAGPRERMPNLRVVREVESTCDFEAHVTWVAGVARPNPFRVLTLKDPARLVVDVRTDR